MGLRKRYQFFTLKDHEIALWRASLAITEEQESDFLHTLSSDEIERANRFQFPVHRLRFIAARGTLRAILAMYLSTTPDDIVFSYTDKGKPYLADSPLQFNLSHSEDMAVYAITKDVLIGVDIEKTQATYEEGIAKRYFSDLEFQTLQRYIPEKRAPIFYQIWSQKEAYIKAVGSGLHHPLTEFSLPVQRGELMHKVRLQEAWWTLQNFSAHPQFQSAVITQQVVEKTLFWEWTIVGPQIWK